ncbi:MAG: hypothetical protein ACI4DK_07225 [Lachnospiraceae bacterium]
MYLSSSEYEVIEEEIERNLWKYEYIHGTLPEIIFMSKALFNISRAYDYFSWRIDDNQNYRYKGIKVIPYSDFGGNNKIKYFFSDHMD